MGVGEQLSYAFGALSARARDAKREDGVVAAARVVLEALPVVAQELGAFCVCGVAEVEARGGRLAQATKSALVVSTSLGRSWHLF